MQQAKLIKVWFLKIDSMMPLQQIRGFSAQSGIGSWG